MIYEHELAGHWLIAALSVYLVAVTFVLGYVLWNYIPDIIPPAVGSSSDMPTVQAATSPDADTADTLETATSTPPIASAPSETVSQAEDETGTDPSFDLKLFLVICAVGAVGGLLHAINSLTAYVGNGKFVRSWTLWYLFRPVVGALLASIFYVVFRGGLLPASQVAPENVNVYGLLAIAGLVGLFSDNATLKLKDVFEAAFQTQDHREDKLSENVVNKSDTTIGSADKKQLLQSVATAAQPANQAETSKLETALLKQLPHYTLDIQEGNQNQEEDVAPSGTADKASKASPETETT